MIRITAEPFDAPDSQMLLAELAEDLQRRYGGDSEPGPKPTVGDVALFLVAREKSGAPVGCAALVLRQPPNAELKRMYVRPAARRDGVGWQLLEEIERRALELRARRIVLETGLAQPEAMALYRRAGYHPVAPFGVYKESPLSRCFARDLAATPTAIVADPVTDELPSGFFNRPLADVDPEIADVLASELERQQHTLEMIASENFVPVSVLECQGSVLTNKYAEGYPGRRYYGGCEYVDIAEQLAIDRAKELFGAEHANVQPHAGAQANTAVYQALLEPGDSFLGLALDHGGHLTHGRKVNVSGKLYQPIPYHVREADSIIDMDEVERLAKQHRPKMVLAGWSAYPRILDFERFRAIADEIGAILFVDMAHFAGLVAAGLHPNPVPYADVVTTTIHKTLGGGRGGMILCREELAKPIDSAVFPGQQGGPLEHVIAGKAVALRIAGSDAFRERQERTLAGARAVADQLLSAGRGVNVLTGGTDVHLVLCDLRESELDGQQAEDRLAAVGITVNRNTVPFDPRPPAVSSGLRIGTPALATRGLQVDDFVEVGRIMAEALTAEDFEERRGELAERAAAVADRYPLYTALTAPATV